MPLLGAMIVDANILVISWLHVIPDRALFTNKSVAILFEQTTNSLNETLIKSLNREAVTTQSPGLPGLDGYPGNR